MFVRSSTRARPSFRRIPLGECASARGRTSGRPDAVQLHGQEKRRRSRRCCSRSETPEKGRLLPNPDDENVSEIVQKPLDRLRTPRSCSAAWPIPFFQRSPSTTNTLRVRSCSPSPESRRTTSSAPGRPTGSSSDSAQHLAWARPQRRARAVGADYSRVTSRRSRRPRSRCATVSGQDGSLSRPVLRCSDAAGRPEMASLTGTGSGGKRR
jgi:hypothetical protein